jgi:hypothetical protein
MVQNRIGTFRKQATYVKKTLDSINMKAVKGQISTSEYENFIKSLNEDIPPQFRIIRRKK